MEKQSGRCALCKISKRICRVKDGDKPAFCSTALYPDALKKAAKEYGNPESREFARQASIQEGEGYIDRGCSDHYRFPIKPRVQEIIEFARKMGYRRLGVAFCTGLHQEADVFCRICETHGFEVVSVVCKVGGVEKEFIGIEECQKVRIGQHETMCNPIAQAEVLNEAKTDFNILLGLCVGHDSLFIKYSKAMVTVFAVKDRLLGHNPLAAIYNYNSYYERFKQDRLKDVDIK